MSELDREVYLGMQVLAAAFRAHAAAKLGDRLPDGAVHAILLEEMEDPLQSLAEEYPELLRASLNLSPLTG